MSEQQEPAGAIVNNYVLWSVGGGLIPFPLADIAAVTALQMSMLQELAKLYEVEYSSNLGKNFVAGLTGSTLARLGASLIKGIPGVGTAIGIASMPIASGASTYAIGQVAISHFESGGNLMQANIENLRKIYQKEYKEGESVAAQAKEENSDS